MTSKTQYKKYLKTLNPDLEDGESYSDWFNAYWQALKEDGKVIKKGRCEYLKDDN